MAGSAFPTPYCGSPPAPADLAFRWNLDPVLIAALAAAAAIYALAARRSRVPRSRSGWFYAGWALTSAALVSPLCPLSVSLFAARVSQHMLLTLVAAPMVALGQPFQVVGAAFLARTAHQRPAAGASKTSIVAAGLFAMLLWYWHTPVPYEFTFQSAVAYWLMHLTLYGSALWLWTALLTPERTSPIWAIAAGLLSTTQMGLLGALITFAPRALYAPHFVTTYAWGLTPLQDQQLGGAIMWAPGCAVFLVAALYEMWRVLSGPVAQRGAAVGPEALAR